MWPPADLFSLRFLTQKVEKTLFPCCEGSGSTVQRAQFSGPGAQELLGKCLFLYLNHTPGLKESGTGRVEMDWRAE